MLRIRNIGWPKESADRSHRRNWFKLPGRGQPQQPSFEPTGVASRWLESTLEVARWEVIRRAGVRWGTWGAMVGSLIGLFVFAPASWLANALYSATQQHFLLAEAQGTIWNGSAVAVLMGGQQSRDARSLPGRLTWQIRPNFKGGLGVGITLTHPCCLTNTATVIARLGLGHFTIELAAANGPLGQWPAGWLAGLGTPWNTLNLTGNIRLTTQPGFHVEWVQGRFRVVGHAELALLNLSSRLTTLDHLGSYRMSLEGNADNGSATLNLLTEEGALQLNGTGQWTSGGLHFEGEARARETERSALDNLLNIIGRRSGERSIISIG